MCAAKIEVLVNGVVARYLDKIFGEGPGSYELRDPIDELDLRGPGIIPAKLPTTGTYQLKLELGENIGKAWVVTNKLHTRIEVQADRGWTSAGMKDRIRSFKDSALIPVPGRSREPLTSEITDGEGNSLVRVTHLLQ